MGLCAMRDLINTNPQFDRTLSSVRQADASKDGNNLKKVSKEIEGLFLNMIITNMRKALAPEGFFGKSSGADIFQSMMEDHLSKTMARRGQVGIAKMIERQLGPEEPSISGKGPIAFSRETPVVDMQKIVQQAAQQTGLSESLIYAVIEQESGGDPQAVSSAGAQGLMQLMPATAASLGVKNPFNPSENIMGGSRYLREMIDRFGSTKLGLAAYNAGPSNVEKYGGIPPFKETTRYVERVMGKMNRAHNN